MTVSSNFEAKPPKATRRSPQQVLDDIVRAAQAEFKENGYERTTTAAIGRKAGVSESQIYRYFATKLDLFHASVFHLVERDMTEFYHQRKATFASGKYEGTINEFSAKRVFEMLSFFRKNSEAIITLMFAKEYVPDAKGFGEITSMNDFFDRSTEAILEWRGSEGIKGKANPNLLMRSLFLSLMANAIFRDIVFPPGIATDEEIDEAIAVGQLEGLSAYTVKS